MKIGFTNRPNGQARPAAGASDLQRPLRVLAHLLGYPDAALRQALPELQQVLADSRLLPAARVQELLALCQHLGRDGYAAEAAYVDTFDRGRGTALHLFEHVHGDSRDRGPAMVALVQTYEAAGLLHKADELPDHLSVALEYASTQPAAAARAFLHEFSHLLHAIFEALRKRQSAYASVLGAVLELAGEKAAAVPALPPSQAARAAEAALASPPEALLDDSWEEPPAFGGCSTQGQARPGQPQPIQVHRHRPGPALSTTHPLTPNPGAQP